MCHSEEESKRGKCWHHSSTVEMLDGIFTDYFVVTLFLLTKQASFGDLFSCANNNRNLYFSPVSSGFISLAESIIRFSGVLFFETEALCQSEREESGKNLGMVFLTQRGNEKTSPRTAGSNRLSFDASGMLSLCKEKN